jgi:hypothetical protein
MRPFDPAALPILRRNSVSIRGRANICKFRLCGASVLRNFQYNYNEHYKRVCITARASVTAHASVTACVRFASVTACVRACVLRPSACVRHSVRACVRASVCHSISLRPSASLPVLSCTAYLGTVVL